MLPDGSGLDFLRELRERGEKIPVLLLTALGTSQDLVTGLSAGGDDYLPKPYDLDVFLAKLEALLRRSAIVPEIIQVGSITVNTISLTAYLNGADMLLSQKEFALLLLFIRNQGKSMASEEIYEKIWGQPMNNDTIAIRYQISKLRKKLENSGHKVSYCRGKGYVFEAH
jgi:DNA-binding response OmpR family regulator